MRRGPALALAAGTALLAAWFHPWQGITLALIVAALIVWRRRPAELGALVATLAAVVLPLVYYLVLAHADPAWRFASHNEDVARLPAWVLVACLGPLVAIATLGVRRPGGALAEQALLLWIPAALVVYFVNDAFAVHALEGVSLPFAVLAVRGAARVRLPALAGTLAVGLLTVPGLAYAARKVVRTARSGLVTYELPRDDVRALRWVHDDAPGGGVLAPTPFAATVPSQTGRAVWVGHGDWSRDYRARSAAADRLFDGRLAPSAARAFVAATGARVLVADCDHPRAAGLAAALGPDVVAAQRRFGCARVIVLRRGP